MTPQLGFWRAFPILLLACSRGTPECALLLPTPTDLSEPDHIFVSSLGDTTYINGYRVQAQRLGLELARVFEKRPQRVVLVLAHDSTSACALYKQVSSRKFNDAWQVRWLTEPLAAVEPASPEAIPSELSARKGRDSLPQD